jgi:hypothetical protein
MDLRNRRRLRRTRTKALRATRRQIDLCAGRASTWGRSNWRHIGVRSRKLRTVSFGFAGPVGVQHGSGNTAPAVADLYDLLGQGTGLGVIPGWQVKGKAQHLSGVQIVHAAQPAAQRLRYSLRSPFGPACGCYSASPRFGLLNGEVAASVRSRIEQQKACCGVCCR